MRLVETERHTYEVLAKGEFVPAGHSEGVALRKAHEAAVHVGEEVRVYHTHPSPGPTRRFMGVVRVNGEFQDAR